MLLIAALLIVIYVTFCYLDNLLCAYWERRGVPYIPATSFFSREILSSFLITPSMLSDIYEKAKNKSFVGFFQMRVPILMVRTPDLIHFILCKEFSSFSSTRKSECPTERDPLSQHLLALNGDRWRSMRSKLSPAFTSGKLKNMFPIIDNHVDQLLEILLEKEGIPIDAEELCGRFSITTILSCSFGLDPDCRDSNTDKFIEVGKSVFEAGIWRLLKARFRMLFPRVFQAFGLEGYEKNHKSFCHEFLKEVIEHRKRTGFYRPDFVEILMKLREGEKSNGDNTHAVEPESSPQRSFTDSLIMAQAFSFLVAGYETSTTTMSATLFELAQDSQLRQKLRAEVRDTLERFGSLNYESVSQIRFLDQVLREALRKHPPVIFLPRICTKETTLPGTSITIEPGTHLLVPVLALHRDPEYYPCPDQFMPQRFANHNDKHCLPSLPYLPFSDGPRKCIGMRFALLELKIALAKILANFDFELDGTTSRKITIEEYARIYKIKNKIKLVFEHCDDFTPKSAEPGELKYVESTRCE